MSVGVIRGGLMAKMCKPSNALKSKTKVKAVKPVADRAMKKNIKLVASQPSVPAKQPVKAAVKEVAKEGTEKKVSQKLLETIERRRNSQAANAKGGSMFGGRPPGRRGRRPKAAAADYTPEHQGEETYVMESDYEGIEYDTGIRVKQGGEDKGFNLDRFEEFDEELNFDW